MMRSLWTAASGMTTQQTNVDTISNNLQILILQVIKRKQQNSNPYSIRQYRRIL